MWNNIQRTPGKEEKWQKLRNNFKELTVINDKQEKRVQYLETTAMHLVMFYIAFQSVIFLSISKPSAIQCSSWWKLFSLSLLIAFIFAINFTITIIKYFRTQYQYEMNLIDKQENFEEMDLLESQQIDINMHGVEMHTVMPGGTTTDLPRSSTRQESSNRSQMCSSCINAMHTSAWWLLPCLPSHFWSCMHVATFCGGT